MVPATYKEEPLPGFPAEDPSAEEVVLGYINAFDPDFLVRLSKNVPQYVRVGGVLGGKRTDTLKSVRRYALHKGDYGRSGLQKNGSIYSYAPQGQAVSADRRCFPAGIAGASEPAKRRAADKCRCFAVREVAATVSDLF